MDLKEFFTNLSAAEQERFAKTAGTTVGYLTAHVLSKRKIPRPPLMNGLIKAVQEQDASISRASVLQFFYTEAAA